MENKIGTCLKCNKPGVVLCLGQAGFDEDPIFLCDEHKLKEELKNVLWNMPTRKMVRRMWQAKK